MSEIFDKEICEFFPFPPYKMQVDFMKILYNVLKKSNIKINDNVHTFHSFLKHNKHIKEKLKTCEEDGSICLDILNPNTEIENESNRGIEEDNSEHIICEMKTGSGKTLTLLSSVVYWLFKHRFDLFLIREKIELGNNEPGWVREQLAEKVLHKYMTKLKAENEKKKEDEKILNHFFDISKDKIMLKENVTIKKKETKVEKPQVTEGVVVEETIKDSMSDVSIEGQTKKQIFICSRTQSQLNQYFYELKKIEKKIQNKISINMILIGSRKHLCINEEFLRKHKGVNELNDCCKNSYCKYKEIFTEQMAEAMRKKKQKKIFYESSRFSSSSSSSGSSSSCSSIGGDKYGCRNENVDRESFENVNNYSLVTKLLQRKNVNMSELKEICKNEKIEICPYYLNRENMKKADIVLLPYICILNQQIRNNLKINIKDNIVIFDESQNIIENINDCNSTSIEYFQIYICHLLLNEYVKKYKYVLNNSNMTMIKQIVVYCHLLMNIFDAHEDKHTANVSLPLRENITHTKNTNWEKEKEKEKENNVNLLKNNDNNNSNGDGDDNTQKRKHVHTIGTEKNKETGPSKIMDINKFNILSKIDAVDLNRLSDFLNNSMFCRKIRIFSECYIHNNFKYLKNCPNFNTNCITTAIYTLSEFTTTLINSNKYDYVYINDTSTGTDDASDDGQDIEKKEVEKKNKQTDKTETLNNKIISAHIPYPKHKKRTQTYAHSEEQDMKRKREVKNQKENDKGKTVVQKDIENVVRGEKDETLSLMKQLFDDMLNKKKNVLKKIEIVSVSSCNNFQKIVKECTNIILIGGTLYPLEEFLLLFLNEKRNKIKLFSSDYIFKKDHVFCRIIHRSIIDNDLIDNTFKNRFNKKHLLNLAIQIYSLTLDTNFGNIVFFPSYKFLKVFTNFLNKEGNYVLRKMMKKKIMFCEKKNDTSVLKEYIQNIKNIKEQEPSRRIKNGCLLFCVMNAKLSEGINFHDEYCRNIIIVGIPFFKFENNESANNCVLDRNALVLQYYKNYSKEVALEKEKEKETEKEKEKETNKQTQTSTTILGVEDVNRMCNTYQVKYAMKIVNQCIGRSMRHLEDFSSFFFLDFRFSKKHIYENFPSFIKRHIDAIEEVPIPENDLGFSKLKQNFTDSYNDFKKYYSDNFGYLQFEKADENQLNFFVKDLYSLNKFHQKMNNV